MSAAISLTYLPAELVECITTRLRGPDLASLACACRSLAAIAGTDRVWRAIFERDLGVAYPPIEHVDHAYYGKDVRWIYGLVATPVGQLRPTPTGGMAGRIVANDGVTMRSGEFALCVDAKGDAIMRLNGYGTAVQSTGTLNDGTLGWSVREGVYANDHIVGRMRRLADGTLKNGAAPTDYSYCFRGDSLDGQDHGFGVTHHSDGHVHYGEHSAEHYDGRCLVLSGTYDVYAGQLVKDAFCGYGVALDRNAGIIAEAHRAQSGPAWSIMRAAQSTHAWRVARAPCCCVGGAQSADSQPGPMSVDVVYATPTTHASYICAGGGTWERYDHRGHTLVLDNGAPAFFGRLGCPARTGRCARVLR
nr:F-box domain [Pandoravirus massiliensis]